MSIRGLVCHWCHDRAGLYIGQSEDSNDGVKAFCGVCGNVSEQRIACEMIIAAAIRERFEVEP